MKLYKYTRFDIGKQIISSSQIALSKPQYFNDPFDCVPVSVDDDLRKAIDILSGYAIDQVVFASLQELKKKLTRPIQKAWLSFVLWEYFLARKTAHNKSILYSPVFTFNKLNKILTICERMGKVPSEQLQLSQLQATIEQQCRDSLTPIFNMQNSLHITCFSTVYDSILMWSYYGQAHHGVCIEFEIEEDPKMLFEVKYCAERPTVQMDKFTKELCGKIFAQRTPSDISHDPTLLSLVVQPYISKAKEWEHEQEYRLIFPEQILGDMNIKKEICNDGKERYMYNIKITKVFIGAAMSDDQKVEIRSIVPSEVEVVEMQISDTKYELLL